MLSNKLTFSLASLVVLLMVALVATPADAVLSAITQNDVALAVNTAVNTSLGTSTDDGGKAVSYTLSPNLPSGLRLEMVGTTPTIVGLTRMGLPEEEFTLTAMATGEDPVEVKFNITVHAPADFGTQTVADMTYKVGRMVNLVLPEASNTDGDDTTYTLTGTIPTGLQFVASTRTLTGVPSAPATVQELTYTATDAESDTGDGNDTLTFMVTVEPDAMPMFDESIADISASVDMAIANMVLPEAEDANAGDTLNYSIAPPLPPGLEFIAAARVLRGTPTVAQAATTYTYTVTDSDGNTAELEFDITVMGLPSENNPMFDPADTIANITATAGMAITSVTLPMATDADTSDTITYAIAPALPAGLMFDDATRMLSGTPTAAAAMATYTYTATSSDTAETAAMLTFTITVNAADDSNMPDPSRVATQTVTVDQAKKTVTVTWTAPTDTANLHEYVVTLITFNDDNTESTNRVFLATTVMTHTFTGVSSGRHHAVMEAIYLENGQHTWVRASGPRDVNILPDVTIKAAAGATHTAPFDVTLTFSSVMQSLPPAYILVGNGRVADGSVVQAHTTAADAGKVWQATIVPYAKATSVTVSVNTAAATTAKVLKVPADPTAADAPVLEGTVSLGGSVAKNGFLVVGGVDAGLDAAGTALGIDLEEFFLNGGTILLIGPSTAKAKDVVISEIMWGSDAKLETETPGAGVNSQWIELYNTTGASISLAGWLLEFLGPNGVSGATGTEVDKVTNLGPTGFWNVPGQSGRSSAYRDPAGVVLAAVDLISMYRNIDYTKVEKTDHSTVAADNRKTQLEGVPDGRVAGNWKASERPSVNISGRRIATPGAKHITRLSSTATALGQSVIINEVGNGSGDSNDWVEILNTTGSEINLKKWELTLVTGTSAADKKEVALVSFPDNDNTKLPANGILLITQSDPTDSGNDLAGGVEINIKAEDQVKRGISSLYYVSSDLKLPDDGKFLLALRNANDKEGKPDNIVDAGGVLFLEVSDTTHNTQVWPLQATAKGHGNVIDAADEAFASGQVYQRNAKNSGIGEKHWKKIGFTGVGYDRVATKEDSNGGTPGYANDARKEKVADLSDSLAISISEIMVDSGTGRRKLPQWIELYNSSMTQAVNTNEWKLEIQNANTEDVDARLNATITLGEMTISPGQTVIIVTTSGLNSGSDHFPGTRLVNLWTTTAHREDLEMTARNDRVLSATGFYLKLTDKDKKIVDEAGNLDGNRRTADDPAWEIPMSSEEGRRSSLIRVYEEGVAIDGTTAAGWVSAADTSLAFAISHTYYGSADDFGTPGFRGGGPLPVSLSSFRPARDKATGAVVIRWTTESELDNAGFNILRSETKNGEFKVVNLKGIIPGHGTTSEKHTYEWKDTSAKPNVVYYYQIEDVSLDGERTTLRTTHLRGNVNAAGKATTTWADLKSQR